MRLNRINMFLASGAAALAVGGATAASASASYGTGALYQVELSMNIPGTQGGGVWLWITLNSKGGGDYAGSDCGHGLGAVSDAGDVTWSPSSDGQSIVIQGVVLKGLQYSPTITIPAAYGHYTGTDWSYITPPDFPPIPSGIGFSELQVAP